MKSSMDGVMDEMPENLSEDQPALTSNEYEVAHGEKLSETLDLDTWRPGADLVEMYERLEREIAEAVRQEGGYAKRIRAEIFPRLKGRLGAPPGAGVYRASVEKLEDVHAKLLFNGGVEACDGTVVTHDTLPMTITQIGVCLVSYQGDQGSWVHRMFRRDLRTTGKNPVDETLELLERRRQRSAVDQESQRDRISSLARRGIMAYAERAALLDRSKAVWRMGHGVPTPYELVTGSGMPDLLRSSIELLRRLVLDHQRFVFIPSTTNARELLTIGNALQPSEYAIIDTYKDTLDRIASGHYRGQEWVGLRRAVEEFVELLTIGNALQPSEYAIIDTYKDTLDRIASGHYRGQEWVGLRRAVEEFVEECGPKIAIGMYRVSKLSPPQMFFAHIDRAHEAALIAMADSVLQEHRGFPMLIDLADRLCQSSFGADTFMSSARAAYSEADEPFRYLAERSTRR